MKFQNKAISFRISSNYIITIDNNKLMVYKNGLEVIYRNDLTKYIGLYNNQIFYKNDKDINCICLEKLTSSELSLNIKEVYLYDKYIFFSKFKNNIYSIYIYELHTNISYVIYSEERMHSFFIQNNYIVVKTPYFINKYIILDFKGQIKKKIYDLEKKHIPILEHNLFYEIVYENETFKSKISIDEKEISIRGRIIKSLISNNLLYILTISNKKSYIYSIDIRNLKINELLCSYLYIKDIYIIQNTLFYDISDFEYQVIIKNNKLEDILPVLKSKFEVNNYSSSNQNCFYTIYENKYSKNVKGIYIFLHGGPHSYVDKDYDELKSFLNYEGKYLLVIINYHGSTTYGFEYEHVIHGRWGDYELKGIEEVYYEILNKFPNLSHNIRVMGVSYGGILAQLLLLKNKLSFKKVISISSPYDIEKFYENLSNFHKNIFKKRAIHNQIKNYNIKEFNPINYLNDKKRETNNIYIYGTKDTKIPMTPNIEKNIIKNVDVFIPVLHAGHSLQEIFFNIEDKENFIKLLQD